MDVLHPSIAPSPTAMQFWATVNSEIVRAWARGPETPPVPVVVEPPAAPVSADGVVGLVGTVIDVRA